MVHPRWSRERSEQHAACPPRQIATQDGVIKHGYVGIVDHLVPIVGESYRMKEIRSRKKGGEAQKQSA